MTPRNLGKPRSVLLLFTRKTTLTRHAAVLGDAVAEVSEGCELVLELRGSPVPEHLKATLGLDGLAARYRPYDRGAVTG